MNSLIFETNIYLKNLLFLWIASSASSNILSFFSYESEIISHLSSTMEKIPVFLLSSMSITSELSEKVIDL